ncbi:MAG: SAVED domain-containing protein [Tepidisphaeraceae bacterium]
MASNKKKSGNRVKRAAPRPGSLLTPESVGGIVGGKGFDFQTRYAACHLPLWLAEGSFHELFHEGTGDIDIRFLEAGKATRNHIQIKDHEVSLSEFKEVLENFRRLDAEFSGIYKRFTLASTQLAKALRPLETGLSRWRGAKPFYEDVPHALLPTEQDVDERIAKLGLADHAEFIREKLDLDVGHGELCQDERAIDLFISRLLKHPAYADKLRAMVAPSYAHVMQAITASKGVVLDRSKLEALIRDAVTAGGETSIVVTVHNWTKEVFDIPPDYELDWSGEFDRSTRAVPTEEKWNGELLRQLVDTKKKILGERKERVIKFRGKCTLSTAIMLGVTFPAVGGWIFEIPQPPQKDPWRSDAARTTPYTINVEELAGDPAAEDLVLGISVKGESRDDVMRHVQSTKTPPKRYVFISPPTQGGQSIGNASDAAAFVNAVREALGPFLKAHQIRKTRLFFYGPFALAVFLGQQITALGQVQLFEFQDPGYVPSCCLRT